MGSSWPDGSSSSAAGRSFPSTHWSVVLAAGDSPAPDSQEALERLCRNYWYPLYCYVRRQGHRPDDAQDLTQEFFARFLEKKYLGLADPQRGRFRSFLLASLRHFLINEWDRATAARRGGGQWTVPVDAGPAEARFQAEPADNLAPERAYEQRWAVALLEQVVTRLEQEYAAAGKSAQFETLRRFLWGADASNSYAEIAARLDSTEDAVKSGVRRLRTRYRQILESEIAQTVATPEDLEDEVRWLFATFA
ncbi:MAG TPA: sigma-70 family RNA polymerase sigma factor [Candidatus Paceibacterota bacterium]|nr:sigma-70 family RNA polymerase sigma factor [Phycisphaerae bacterium]HRZ47366.1 sigma-70 family RNA polymerase sigma factor [Candidatus Paceibacterota bacterium]HSA29814.1 sigma-70 family RNA polymerase sigma factor [Phycisphaerae bacterium]